MTRYLLDTHTLLEWAFAPEKLREGARLAIGNGRSYVAVSAATAWEIAIKRRLGKLDAPGDVGALVRENRFAELPVSFDHALATERLPRVHHDPFDRLLVAQAQVEGLTLITRDKKIVKYDVPTLAA